MPKLMDIQYPFEDGMSVYNIADINSSFASGSLKVLYLGENRNGSYLDKSNVTAALPSLKNVPIVCHYDCDTNQIGGHDMEVIVAEDGSMKLRNLTTPIGVVPETASFRYEKMNDPTGVEREYLIIDDVILWKRQDAYNHIVDDLGGKVGHSMEISITDGSKNKKTGLYEIRKFEFTALCLLETATPCFQGSELEIFSANEFKKQMSEMMAELKETYSLIKAQNMSDDKHPQNSSEEGGVEKLDEKMNLIAEFGLTIDDLDFAINDLGVDELREKLETMKSAEEKFEETAIESEEKFEESTNEQEEISVVEPVEEKFEETSAEEPNDNQFELNSNMRKNLREAVCRDTVMRPWGEERRYYMVDFDLDAGIVYVEDYTDDALYGIPYTMNGDEVVLDYANKSRKKYAIVDYDGGEQVLPFSELVATIETKYTEVLDKAAQLTEQYNAASETIESLNNEVGELKKYKLEIESAELDAKRAEVIGCFEDLDGVEAFENLKASISEYSVEDLEEKCFAIRGRVGTQAKFSLEEKPPKFKVAAPEFTESDMSDPYGGIVEYYKNK